jgi:hypothetical protein
LSGSLPILKFLFEDLSGVEVDQAAPVYQAARCSRSMAARAGNPVRAMR